MAKNLPEFPCRWCGRPVGGKAASRGIARQYCCQRCNFTAWYERNRAPKLQGVRRRRRQFPAHYIRQYVGQPETRYEVPDPLGRRRARFD